MTDLSISDLRVVRSGKVVLAGGGAAMMVPGVALCTGPNGSGKTTLLEALAGILQIDGGSVTWDGEPVDPTSESWRNSVSYLASDGGTVPLLTGAEQLRLILEMADLGRREAESRIEVLTDTYQLGETLHVRADALSTGMKKRLGIAISVATPAKLFLLDEPSAGLDAEGVRVLVDTISVLRDSGAAVVVASHGWEVFADLSGTTWSISPARSGARLVDDSGKGSAGPAEHAHRVELPWLQSR